MRRSVVTAYDPDTGEESEIVMLIPESQEDREEIARMAERGEVEIGEGFQRSAGGDQGDGAPGTDGA